MGLDDTLAASRCVNIEAVPRLDGLWALPVKPSPAMLCRART